MEKFYKLLLIFTFLFFNHLLAQVPSDIEELKEKYENFFELNRENVFLHLNKTAIIPEEDLCLSAYVYNSRLNIPNTVTANLEVGIYTKNGNTSIQKPYISIWEKVSDI